MNLKTIYGMLKLATFTHSSKIRKKLESLWKTFAFGKKQLRGQSKITVVAATAAITDITFLDHLRVLPL